MPLPLPYDATVLFQGDSITDGGRLHDDPTDLGHGFVALAAETLHADHPGLTVLNRGIGGDRVADLVARWERDTLAHAPDLLSVMVGVNDTWRRYDSAQTVTPAAWEADYRRILDAVRQRPGATRLVLIEPFLVPVCSQQWEWREDLDPRIRIVRRLAAEYDALLLAADGLLNQAARTAGRPELVVHDGIHPTDLGHRLLADAWLGLVLADG